MVIFVFHFFVDCYCDTFVCWFGWANGDVWMCNFNWPMRFNKMNLILYFLKRFSKQQTQFYKLIMIFPNCTDCSVRCCSVLLNLLIGNFASWKHINFALSTFCVITVSSVNNISESYNPIIMWSICRSLALYECSVVFFILSSKFSTQ